MLRVHLVPLAALLVVASCSGSAPEPASHPGARAAAQPWERDPFTRTSLIEIDETPRGYLVEYQEIPPATGVTRALPTGSYRIQDLEFEDVGLITSRGGLYRYAEDGNAAEAPGMEPLGSWTLKDALMTFFGGGVRVRLTELEPSPVRSAAPAAPAAEDANAGEGGEEAGDAAASDEMGDGP